MKTTVTLKMIAGEAGCSISVASRALNPDMRQHRTVSKATADAVAAAAQRLGYRAAGSRLRRHNVSGIGVFLPENHTTLMLDLIAGLSDTVNEMSIPVHFYTRTTAENYDDFLENRTSSGGSFGIISYCHFHSESEKLRQVIEKMRTRDNPVVIIHDTPPPDWNAVSVRIDNFRGGYLAGKYLAEKNCGEYYSICGSSSRSERLNGFQQALHESSQAPTATSFLRDRTPNSPAQTVAILEQITQIAELRSKYPIGLFIDSDSAALTALGYFNNHGLKVGEKVMLVGYNDEFYGRFSMPGMTTIRQPFHQMGHIAMTKLLRMLNGYCEQSELLIPELVVRGTA